MTVALHTILTPQETLPDVKQLHGPVSVDTETDGLYVDDGHRVAAVSVTFKLRSDALGQRHSLAFPFDQGRYVEKGFEIQRYKRGDAKGVERESDLEEWLADYNLGRAEWDFLMDWLVASGREVGHTYQNAAFDLLMIAAGTRVRNGGDGGGYPGRWLEPFVVWDTMLASKTLWPTEPTGLKPTAARLFGREAVEDAVELRTALIAGKKLFGLRAEHGPRYDLVPWRVNGKYAASDTDLTFRLRDVQETLMAEGLGNGWPEFKRAMNLMRVLTRMSYRGFGPYSAAESHEWANVIAGRVAELEKQLPFAFYGALPHESTEHPNTGDYVSASAARATEFYFEKLGYKPWKVGETKRGYEVGKGLHKKFLAGVKSDRREIERRFPAEAAEKLVTFKQGELTADIAERLGREGAPGATEYSEYLRLKIANQMFYRNYAELIGPDGKLRTTYRQAHVKSARLSVERFQAQALPKGIKLDINGHRVPEPRSFFGVPEGRVRWNLDLSQAELRIAANLSSCVGLMRELNEEGGDVHGKTCERTFGIKPDHPEWKAKRDVAKRLNFGGIFLIGPATFRTNLWKQGGIEWSLAQCKEAVFAFRDAYPEIKDAYEYWLRYSADHGCVMLYNNERSWFGPRDYPNTGWNRRVQGSLAAWVAEWLTLVEQVTEKDDALVLSVHDSAVLDLPIDTADATVKRVLELSEELWFDRFGFPGVVDADTWTYHEGVDLLVPAHLKRELDCPQVLDEDELAMAYAQMTAYQEA